MNVRRSNSLKTDFVAESLKHLHMCMDIQKQAANHYSPSTKSKELSSLANIFL